MASIFELKTDSQWIMVKTTINPKKFFYQFKNNIGTLQIEGADKFFNVIPFEKGVGAVAIKNEKHKTVNVVWYVLDEDGAILETTKNYKVAQAAIKYYREHTLEKQI